ncbi:MAG TPA: response regulator [Candidatus Limnocylindrales bacterium]|nr:response regulator [Candidatus Limnocylindrales bacterium]
MAKILYVEDEDLLVQVFSDALKNEGFTVESATDGEVALIKVDEFHPDLSLLDVKLPKLNGIEVLKKLKEKEETKHIPVIMFTNQGDKTVDVEAAIK